jgi:3-deoxy-7-phosphoheptulonate synthase
MIVAMQEHATEEQIQDIIARLTDIGFNVHRTTGVEQTILAGVGTPAVFEAKDFELLPGVAEAHRITSPYKLAGRGFRPGGTIVKFPNGVSVGGNEVVIMGGPCSVESREQIFLAAAQVKAAGGQFLRGGAFKPRSSPYSFQGMGLDGLKLLREAGDATGLLIVSEVMEIAQIELMLPYIDVFQVGARNMQNFNLLRELGQTRRAIVLKRGMSATIEELLLSAEYILAGGNYDLMLCERGIRTFETYTRNTMDISAIPVIHKLSHLPILGDPSHGVGRRDTVPPMAKAALAAGADGLLMEMHPNPDKAVSDGAQSLFPEQFEKLVEELRIIAPAIGRKIAAPVSVPESIPMEQVSI